MMLHRLSKLFSFGKGLKVGWILLGDTNVGSSRIHGINIHNFLLKNGFDSVICQTNTTMVPYLTLSDKEQSRLLSTGFDILIFQKVFDENAINLAQRAKRKEIKSIFLVSDKIETDMVRAVDQLVVTSEFLQDHYKVNYGIDSVLIEDAIEVGASLVKQHLDKEKLLLI
jgi:hypothetical protein